MPEELDEQEKEAKAKEIVKQFMMGNGYGAAAVDLIMDPVDMRICDYHNAFGIIDGYCGDTMMMWIQVENGIIVDASFNTDGCNDSIAAGGMATKLAKGKTLDQAMEIDAEVILEALGGIPSEGGHCAELASNTLRVTISDYRYNNEQA
ncbi:MAG: iron-sulfur cluster assembly scaffold protein [Dehalococcoidales bacterium]|jgi:nitrogen fixation NifU-like protein|nr:iron-sulfur cluster assembly scaffold protein [Dehalococcoidales bacterium]MDD4465835.1 iron-sulfur cluster assembly scaffold protein [Dehalococcoidales bacterium]MDD5402821.1 iron-sulfur cluster assembly scaffold protein [Dehalococcoidales bacterium]